MKRERIVVLGGEGFVGRNLLDILEETHECFSVASQQSIFSSKNSHFLQKNPYKESVEVTGDILIHLIDNASLEDEAFEEAEKNLIQNTFHADLKQVVLFSSAVVYANPDSPYGKRKLALEKLFSQTCKERGIPLTIFRLFNVYGRYQIPYRPGSFVANLLYNHLTGKSTEVNDLTAERDFIFVGDIGHFVALAINQKKEGTFDLAGNELCSLGDMIVALEEALGEPLHIEHKNIQETAKSPAGTNPFVGQIILTPVQTGLRMTIAFYREHLEEIKSTLS